MADMAEYAYQQGNKLVQEAMATFINFLKVWADLVYDNIAYAPYRKLANWIREGGECKCYQIQAQDKDLEYVVREMRRRIENEKLGAFRITDSGMLIVSVEERERIQEINRDILVELCNYYQEVDLRELEDAVSKLPPMFEKDMLILNGLSKHEAEVIKNKCNNITKGFMVGISQPDVNEKYNLGVRADKVFIEDVSDGKYDFCKASLNAMISLWGVNHEDKVKELNTDWEIDKLIFHAADLPEAHYVAGSDKKSYIEISDKGFRKYSVRPDEKGHFTGVPVRSMERSDVNFCVELYKELDTVFDERIFTNIDELNDHLVKKDKKELGKMNECSPRNKNGQIQRTLTDKMDQMIKARMMADDKYDILDVEQKYNCYIWEASHLLAELAKDEPAVPDGYTKEQMDSLKKELTLISKDSIRFTYGDESKSREDKSTFTRVSEKLNSLHTTHIIAKPLGKEEYDTVKEEARKRAGFNKDEER